MTAKQLEAFKKKLEKRISILSKERDELRDMECQLCGLAEEVEEAIDALNDARDSLDNAAEALSRQF